jgi:Uri superfamily endonuclease
MMVEHSGGSGLDVATIKPQPGTYALVLSATRGGLVQIGRLGKLRLQHGFYVYVGSALGPGGVRARLAHHTKLSSRPHWHIDYFRKHAALEEVWYCYDRTPWEHEWARHIGMARAASVPLAGFGASDCRCESHLYFFESRPPRDGFVRSLQASGFRHPLPSFLSEENSATVLRAQHLPD